MQSIQRYASETTSESTVRSVPIPSDDMKGKHHQREGRNIAPSRRRRAWTSSSTTPRRDRGVVVRQGARRWRSSARAWSPTGASTHAHRGGRRAGSQEMEASRVVKYGKDAVLEAKLRNVHPMRDAMGKPTSAPRTGRTSCATAWRSRSSRRSSRINWVWTAASPAGAGSARHRQGDGPRDGGRPPQDRHGVRQGPRRGGAVLNAIGGHHGDIPATSWYTPIVMAADAVSGGARPGAAQSLESTSSASTTCRASPSPSTA